MSTSNQYWIPNLDIHKKVITEDIQYCLGPEATVRPWTREGKDGFLITCPGDCLTDEQIDDICVKSKELWEKETVARGENEIVDKPLKQPLHKPVIISRNSRASIMTPRRRSLSGDGSRYEDRQSRVVTQDKQLDMNDPLTLDLYTQFVDFRRDTGRNELIFENPTNERQDLLYSLARKVGLDYKHNFGLCKVGISKTSFVASMGGSVSFDTSNDSFGQLNLEQLGNGPSVLDSNSNETGITPLLPLPDFLLDESSNTAQEDLDYLVDFPEIFNPPQTLQPSSRTGLPNNTMDSWPDFAPTDLAQKPHVAQFSDGVQDENPHSLHRPRDGSDADAVAPTTNDILLSMTSKASKSQGNMDQVIEVRISRAIDRQKEKLIPQIMDMLRIERLGKLKAVGACWKCKKLRKKCDNDPCQECLKGDIGSN